MTSRNVLRATLACWLAAGTTSAWADPEVGSDGELVRSPDATLGEIFHGPFPSSHLFAMPTAQVVGAYQLALSGDASLVSEPGVLSTSSLVAIGFGDLAQLEYRHSSAISDLGHTNFGLPAVGVQLALPLPERRWVPRVAVALRLGLDHDEAAADGASFSERASDLYVVSGLDLGRFTVHGGVRFSAARITSDAMATAERTLVLPAAGVTARVAPTTVAIAEVARVPRFAPGDATHASAIGAATFARAGIRWSLLPWLSLDASVGYRIEIQRQATTGSEQLLDWDIRLGGEIAVPWGAVSCRAIGWFCS